VGRVWAINQLRNEMAHNLDSKKIDEKMKFLRKTYIDALEPSQLRTPRRNQTRKSWSGLVACAPASSGS
jgi:hypothetical protein